MRFNDDDDDSTLPPTQLRAAPFRPPSKAPVTSAAKGWRAARVPSAANLTTDYTDDLSLLISRQPAHKKKKKRGGGDSPIDQDGGAESLWPTGMFGGI